ncbi:MbtH family protein [Streptomyces chattanoogensis]|uniref:MbtH family protein n=1 Tax=Streptomyces chattanoogensis TaxID=66876 RepID=UPI0006B50D1C|nr:MbtH family NRPS accessory protein [Streptomyces chattanoogensis]
MASNPFENPDGSYSVLVNGEGQHSLWPAAIKVPEGWTVALEDSSRQECLDYVEAHWTDMRPISLQNAMTEYSRD